MELNLPANQELAFLRFVAATLAYLVIPEMSYLRIVERVISRAIKLGAHEDVSAMSIIDQLCLTASHREQLAIQEVSSQLDRWLLGQECPELLFATYAISVPRKLRVWQSTVRSVTRRAGGLSVDLGALRQKSKAHLKNLADASPRVARAYIFVYGQDRESLYRSHGPELLKTSASPLVPQGIDNFLVDALNAVLSQQIENVPAEVKADCAALIHLVVEDVINAEVRLSRLMLPALVKGSNVVRELERTFRKLWSLVKGRTSNKPLELNPAECLVCILSMVNIEDELIQPTQRQNYHNLPAPPKIVRRLIERVHEPELRAWLDDWSQVLAKMSEQEADDEPVA